MAYEIGLSDAGLTVPRMADYLEEVRDRYKQLTALDVDWNRADDLLLVPLTAIMAQLLGEQAEVLQAVYDSFDVNGARGVQLSNLAQIVGVTRKRATHGQAELTATGTPGTWITIGKLVEGGGLDGRARWRIIEDVMIPASGSTTVLAEAVDKGRIEALAGEIDKIVTPVTGWDSVTNALAASAGRDAETDDQLRVRRGQSIQLSAGVSIGSIRSKVLALEFVESASVIDNPDNNTRVVEGISLPGNSFLVIVSPNTLTTGQQQELLRLLYDNTPIGVRTAGTDVVGTVTGADGFEKEVSFDFAESLTANIVATLTMAVGYSAADAGPALQALVEAHIANLLIGEPLYRLQIYRLAGQVPGVVAIEVTINGLNEDLDPNALQQVVMGSWAAVAA
jgi:uncharacterized phage protein gp47/JayE